MSYRAQYSLALAVAVALAILGAIQLANAETLGITPRVSAWLGIVSVGLGILAGFLPNVRGTGHDPDTLVDRVWRLPPDERQQVARELAHRAEVERLFDEPPNAGGNP